VVGLEGGGRDKIEDLILEFTWQAFARGSRRIAMRTIFQQKPIAWKLLNGRGKMVVGRCVGIEINLKIDVNLSQIDLNVLKNPRLHRSNHEQ
jgi:hypothetical protein